MDAMQCKAEDDRSKSDRERERHVEQSETQKRETATTSAKKTALQAGSTVTIRLWVR